MRAVLNVELISDRGFPKNYGGLMKVIHMNALIAQTSNVAPRTVVLVANDEDCLRVLRATDPELQLVSIGSYPNIEAFLSTRVPRAVSA